MHKSIWLMRSIQSMCSTELMSWIRTGDRVDCMCCMLCLAIIKTHVMQQVWQAWRIHSCWRNLRKVDNLPSCHSSCIKLQTANIVCGQASRITTWTTLQHVQSVGKEKWVAHPAHRCSMWAVLVCFQNVPHLNTDAEGEEIGQAALTTKRCAMHHVHVMHGTPAMQYMNDIQLIHESIRLMRWIQSMCCTEPMSCMKAWIQHGLPVMHAIHGMHQKPCHAASLASLENTFMLKKPQEGGQFAMMSF